MNYAYFPGKFLFTDNIFKLQFSEGKSITNSASLETIAITLHCFLIIDKVKLIGKNFLEKVALSSGKSRNCRDAEVLNTDVN